MFLGVGLTVWPAAEHITPSSRQLKKSISFKEIL
jgi:hypothetical protein